MVSIPSYTGTAASEYEAKRQGKDVWAAEQSLIAEMVDKGPVLDVPIGTGRYLPIYEAKGIWPWGLDVSEDMIAEALKKRPKLDYQIGSILDIPWPDQHFALCVCTRLLNWLSPKDMQRAVRELLRVAPESIVSIRLGKSEQKKATITHGWDDFLDALAGAWIAEQRQVKDETPNGVYWMLRLRRPAMQDVLDQFQWNKNSLQTLAEEWCDRYRVPRVEMKDLPVRCEYLTGREIGATVDAMAELEPRLLASGSPSVAMPPRRMDGPITWLEFNEGFGQADGRHRVHRWRETEQRYPVLIVDCR